MNLGLQGKIAVVSGSTAGIGLAIATALATEGAKVIINGRTEARVAEALEKIRQRVPGADARGIAADLGAANGADAFLKKAPDADVLVNNLVSSIPGPSWKFPTRSGCVFSRSTSLAACASRANIFRAC
jgi:NAD(P)-dependent dehydrogenase (short-subunit alcohol dehydrogenase family)